MQTFQSLSSYSEFVAYYQSRYPAQLRGFMPEYQIEEPANYWPVKTFAVGAMMSWDSLKHEVNNSYRTYCRASMLAMVYQTPTFFVTSQLVAAALRTELPADLDLSQLNWPFPIMVFMLPKGTVCHPTEGEAAFICIGLMPASFKFPTPPDWRGKEVKFESPYSKILAVSMMPEPRPPMLYYASTLLPPDKSTLSEV
jgi:hypothetical protein